ncbi:MAG: hypothetical protein DSO07_10930 [Thermoproteota archaeon]|uniref:DUF973 family protein n=1 Tax=Candidatus Methanodesulfokora washburnensis TaxID=2478471 RepID=A0A520KQA2_9CREN|nr:MAG: DUF973 family protein [Candidatus Methanodesulfokores washburnensis]TDA39046.1 MAG: hypothetical protein DSO07_10930 [Candidatus Korarchaeota archaeon]
MLNESRLDELTEGIERLKNGALISVLSIVFGIAAFLLLLAVLPHMRFLNISLYSNITTMNRTIISIFERKLVGALPYIAVSGLMLILSAILAIASFVLFFMATGNLKKYSEKFGIGRIGLIIVLLSLLLVLVAVPSAFLTTGIKYLPSFPALMLMTIALVFLSILLSAVGQILFSIMLIRLSEEKDVDEGFRIAGILLAVSAILIFIPFISIAGLVLDLVALILIYTSAKNSLNKLKSGIIVP